MFLNVYLLMLKSMACGLLGRLEVWCWKHRFIMNMSFANHRPEWTTGCSLMLFPQAHQCFQWKVRWSPGYCGLNLQEPKLPTLGTHEPKLWCVMLYQLSLLLDGRQASLHLASFKTPTEELIVPNCQGGFIVYLGGFESALWGMILQPYASFLPLDLNNFLG